jgi:microtubule-associated protein-like 6
MDEEDEESEDAFFDEEDNEEGDEFMAVKPWIGAIREPSGFIKPPLNYNKAPNAKLKL